MLTKKRIVVVEDDSDLRVFLSSVLTSSGFSVSGYGSGLHALKDAEHSHSDLYIIDLGLPDIDGMSLVRQLRNDHRYGIIVLSGRGTLADRVQGLEDGADDYLPKPFEPQELVARVRSVLRRNGVLQRAGRSHERAEASFGQWHFDVGRLILRRACGREETLTAAEGSLLLNFLKSPNRILSREFLQRSDQWRDEAGLERSIDVRISRIRRKIEEDTRNPQIIKTVYGAGYMLAAQVSWRYFSDHDAQD